MYTYKCPRCGGLQYSASPDKASENCIYCEHIGTVLIASERIQTASPYSSVSEVSIEYYSDTGGSNNMPKTFTCPYFRYESDKFAYCRAVRFSFPNASVRRDILYSFCGSADSGFEKCPVKQSLDLRCEDERGAGDAQDPVCHPERSEGSPLNA